MFEKNKVRRLSMLENYAPRIRSEFAELLNAKALIDRFSATKLRSLQVEAIDDHTIDVLYLGTTIRFQLFITYDDEAIGRVICFHKYQLFEKVRFHFLGEFAFDPSGKTDLPLEDDGTHRTLSKNSDEIIIEFLDQAVEGGPPDFGE